jgi:hypothetical protein
LQINGLAGLEKISAIQGDEYGRALISGGWQYELCNDGDFYTPLRVQVHEDARREDVIALLRQAADWLAQDWFGIADEKPASVPETPVMHAYGEDFFPAFDERPSTTDAGDIPL